MPRCLRRFGIGAREHVDPVGVVRARGPDLLPVDHEVVAVAHGARLQTGQVRAVARLGEALRPVGLRVGDARQVLLTLRLGAVQHQARPNHRDALTARSGRPAIGRFLAVDHLLDVARAATAVLLRPGHRQPALGRRPLLKRALGLVEGIVARFVRALGRHPVVVDEIDRLQTGRRCRIR